MTDNSRPTRDDLPETELLDESDTEVIAPTLRAAGPATQRVLRKRRDTQKPLMGRAGSAHRAGARFSSEKAAVSARPVVARVSVLAGLAATVALIGAGGYYRWLSGAGASPDEPLTSPPKVTVEVEMEESERISRILAAAELHMRVGRLTEPEGSNAYVAYSEVLRLDPDNPQALEGMQAIAQHYLDAARKVAEDDGSSQALVDIQHALQLFPENVELRALRDQVAEAAVRGSHVGPSQLPGAP